MSEHREPLPDIVDEEVRRAYGALPTEEVPPDLDARVLHTAQAAVAKRRKPAWLRWSAPIALAASLVIVVAIVLNPSARKEVEVALPLRVDQVPSPPPAAEPVTPAPMEAAPPAASAPLAKVTREVPPSERERKAESRSGAGEAIDAPTQRAEETLQNAPMAGAVMNEEAAAEREISAQSVDAARRSVKEQRRVNDAKLSRELDVLAREAPPATAITSATQSRPATPAAAAPRDLQEIQMSGAGQPDAKLDAWLRKIMKLQTAGDDQRAEREIEELRKAYPGLDIPAALERLRRQGVGKP